MWVCVRAYVCVGVCKHYTHTHRERERERERERHTHIHTQTYIAVPRAQRHVKHISLLRVAVGARSVRAHSWVELPGVGGA